MAEVIEIIQVRKGCFKVLFLCDYCLKETEERKSHFDKTKNNYCSSACYWNDRRENWEPSQQPTWRGGVSQTEAHRRWKKKNPKRMAHLKARRYAREKGADGLHTYDEWVSLCKLHNNKCVICGNKDKLTKDHIIPLSKGGSDYIQNIQPMCRSCNSKKNNKIIHDNPELLKF